MPSSRSAISVARRFLVWIARVERPGVVPWLVIAGVGPTRRAHPGRLLEVW
jgi:hypothetical protein